MRIGGEKNRHPRFLCRIQQTAEEAKKILSTQDFVPIHIPAPNHRHATREPLRTAIERGQFEEWTRLLCRRMLIPARQVLHDSGVAPSDIDRVILVGGATRMPMVRRVVAELTGKTPFTTVDPDRAVALGAAVHAGMLEGSIRDSVLVDVVPLSLSIETQGGLCARLIERNSRVPTSKDRIFTTACDNQPEVEIHVLQGEREFARDNVSLGRFALRGIAPALKGEPKINVTFSVDVNGMLEVSARDIYSGEQRTLKVRSTTWRARKWID